MRELFTANEAVCQSINQKAAEANISPAFLSNFIYPKMFSSGIAPPMEFGARL